MEAVREKKRTKTRRPKQETQASRTDVQGPDDDFVRVKSISENKAISTPPPEVAFNSDAECISLSPELIENSALEEETVKEDETANNPSAPCFEEQTATTPPSTIESTLPPSRIESAVPPEELHKYPDLPELESPIIEESSTHHAPSAPELCDLDFYQIQQINRGILNEIQQMQTHSLLKPVITLQEPYSAVERNQLYFNPKLETVLSFENNGKKYFTDHSDQMSRSQLFSELEAYYNLQRDIHNLQVDVSQLKESFPKIRKRIWCVQHTTAHFSGKCGRCPSETAHNVAITHLTGNYSENWALSFKESLVNYAEISCNSSRGKIILRDLQMLNISTLVQEIIDRSKETPRRDELRVTLTTLFHFVVKKTATKDFRENVKNWLGRILLVFNNCSLLEDQLFLMSHVLRCPTEAALVVIHAVNIAPAPGREVNAELINEWLAVLWLCLRPVRQWNKKGHEESTEQDANWSIVDSEGEDAEEDNGDWKYPNESVLLDILDRIPLGRTFEAWLATNELGNSIYMVNLLRLILFSSAFVHLVSEGPKTYPQDRYKTFLKRLAGIVKWSADLVTSSYDLYRSGDQPRDNSMMSRLATEYNIFMVRVCESLTRNKSMLQYLSQLDFSHLEVNSYWKMAYYLLTSFPEDLSEDFSADFKLTANNSFSFSSSQCTISQWSSEELYFVLETISSLAISCGDRDPGFTEWVVQKLCQVGFVLEDVRDKCYKSVRDLLLTVTSNSPLAIEMILREIQLNLTTISDQALYMLKALPYDSWRPSMDTVDVIADMLENYALDSVQHNIGKLLVSYMNWGHAAEDGGLVLGHEYHCRVAMVVLSATTKKFPRLESYKRISLTGIDANPEKRYIAWAWKMVTKLKVHSMDQGAEAKLQKMENNSIKVIPLLRTEFVPTMQRLVQVERNPLASYISLLMCDWGNDTEEVLSQGLPLIVNTMENMPLVIVLRCLELIVPLFLNSADDLIKSEDCARIVDVLLAEEKSLLSLQLTWKASEVVCQFAEMVLNHILEFSGYGWESVQRITWIWTMLLTRNPNWYSNNNCLYILERMLQIAATIPGILEAVRDYVYPLSLELKLKQKARRSFITKNVVAFPWCSLLFLELEFNCYEQVTNDWLKLVDRMSGEEKKSVQQILKELTDVYSASELSVFKWADFLCKLDVENSVFSIALIQYWRLIKQCPQLTTQNPGLIARLEGKLKISANTFSSSALGEKDTGLKRVYQSLSSLFVSVAEKRHGTLENSIDSRNAFVLDYLHMPSLRSEMRKLTDNWKLISFRQEIKRRGTNSKSLLRSSEISMKERRLRIFEMLKQQKECESVVVLSEEFNIKGLLVEAGRQKNFTRFLEDIWKEYRNVMQVVDRQKQLEFQLYIEKLISYHKTFHCKSCLRTIHVPVRCKELVKSSETGDQNMELILSYNVNETTNRDGDLVKYFFGLQYNMRTCVSKCQEGDHSQCSQILQRSLEICQQFDEQTVLKFTFFSEILNKMKERFKVLTRRHCSSQAHQIVKVIFRNPVMANLLMDVLDPDQLDDGSYLRVLRDIFEEGRNGEKTLGLCFQKMKVGERASRLGITESYRLSIIRFVFEYLPKKRTEMFDLLAKEVYTVMLRHISLMPEVMKFTFNNQWSKTDLLNVLLQILDLSSDDSDFERLVDRVSHLFTSSVIEWTVDFMHDSLVTTSTVHGKVLAHFFRLLSTLLLQLNSAFGPANLHRKIALMYHDQIVNRSPESANFFTEGYFQVLKSVPSEDFLALQLQWYLQNFSMVDDKAMAVEKHKFYASAMDDLSWEKFSPSAEDVAEIYRRLSLQSGVAGNRNNSSVSQRVICRIIVKINWRVVREERLANEFADPQFLARLFFIAIRVPYELPEESKGEILKFYESLEKLPWHWVREANYEEALNWIVQSYPQMPFVGKLSVDLDEELLLTSVENGMMSLLFMAARVFECQRGHFARNRDPLSDAKKRRLTGAMVRVFAMSTGCEVKSLQTGFGAFLETMRTHFSQLDSECTSELEFFQGELLKLLDDKALSWPYFTVLHNEVAATSDSDEQFVQCFLRTLASIDVITKSRAKFFECLLSNYFRACSNNSHPWQRIEELCLQFVLKLRLDHLKDLELYLSLHLYTTCKLKMCDNMRERIVFIEELINWLPNIQFTEQNEVYLLLLWSQVVCIGAEIYLKEGSSGILEKCQKYLKSSPVLRSESWGKSIFNAIGLAKMQKLELCIRYIIYSLITCFTELRESTTESSVKFVQQFEADAKSSKIGNFKAQLDDLFGSGQSMVTSSRENYSATLIQFIRVIYTTTAGCTDWFKNVHDFWRGSIGK